MTIASTSFSRLPVKRKGHEQQDDAPLPLLEEVIRRYAGCAFLDIELKVPGLEAKVAALIRETPCTRGYVISSFLPEVVETLARKDSSLRLGFICENRRTLSHWRDLPIEFLIPNYRLVSPGLVETCHEFERKILVWTVNHPSTLRAMENLRVDGIISDHTKLMLQILRPPSHPALGR